MWNCSRSKSSSILTGINERLYHFGIDEVSLELVQFVQPEVIAVKVQPRLRRIVRIASQVTEVLHQDEGTVELGGDKIGILRDGSQNLRAGPCPKCQIPH